MALVDSRTDADLVLAARAGDRDALRELLDTHEGGIAVVCRRYLRGHDVGDAVQETLLRAMQSLDQLRDPDGFGPWVRTIARNVSCDLLGGNARTITVPDLLVDAASDEPTPDLQVLASEEHEVLHRRLANLGDRDARALWLRDAHGATVPEVAAAMDVTEGSARVLLSRARSRLREAYTGVAALLGLWRGALRERLPAGGTVPAWAVAAPAAAVVAVTLAVLAPSSPPVDEEGPRPSVSADVAARTAPLARSTAGAPVATTEAPTSTPAPRVPPDAEQPGPLLDAGPVSIGHDRPDDEPLAAVGGDDPDSRGAEIFAGNLHRLVEDPVGSAAGAVEHADDVVDDTVGASPVAAGG